jgi:hypothetical protein
MGGRRDYDDLNYNHKAGKRLEVLKGLPKVAPNSTEVKNGPILKAILKIFGTKTEK